MSIPAIVRASTRSVFISLRLRLSGKGWCLRPYFYTVLGRGAGLRHTKRGVEVLPVIEDGEHIWQHTLGTTDETVMLVLATSIATQNIAIPPTINL